MEWHDIIAVSFFAKKNLFIKKQNSMKYQGQFADIRNVNYEVTFITGGSDSGSTIPLKFGGNPIKITTKSDGLFTPIKSRGATIQLVSEDYYFDLYSKTPKGTSVTIRNTSTNTVVFRGYVTPNIYSQTYDNVNVIDIECIEAMSILQFYDYEPISGGTVSTHSVYTVLKKLLHDICGYDTMYFSRDITDNYDGGAQCLFNMSLNEMNFFDDDGEYVYSGDTTTYEAETWKCDEVLTEICKFLNVSAFIHENEVYLMNYYCSSGLGHHFWPDDDERSLRDLRALRKYNFVTDEMETTKDGNVEYTITANSYKAAGATLDLTASYNKILVECNEYAIENTSPDFFDGKMLIPNAVNVGGEWIGNNGYIINDFYVDDVHYIYYMTRYLHKQWQTYNYGAPHTQEFFGKLYPSATDNRKYIRTLTDYTLDYLSGRTDAMWYYNYKYVAMLNDGVIPSIQDGHVWNDTVYAGDFQQMGATILRYWQWNTSKTIPATAEWKDAVVFSLGLPARIFNSGVSGGQQISGRTTAEQLEVLNTFHQANDVCFAEYTHGTQQTYGDPNKDTYIVINGNVMYSMLWNFPTDEIEVNADYAKEWKAIEGDNANWRYPTVCMQVQIGDKYYDGRDSYFDTDGYWVEDYEWTTDSTAKFYVPANNNNNLVYNNWMAVYNTVEFTMNLNKSGFCVRIPAGQVMRGTMKIRFYCPYLYHQGKVTQYQISSSEAYATISTARWVAMKDFEINYLTQGASWTDPDYEDTDTTYFNIPDETYTEELDAIQLKINTQVENKKPSYSSVLNNKNNGYIGNVASHALNISQIQEHNIIEQQHAHYSNPKITLGITIPYYEGNTNLAPWKIYKYPTLSQDAIFFMDATEIDLKNNKQAATLQEF